MAGVISQAEPTVRIVVFLPYPSRDTGGWQVTVPDYRWGGGMGGINRRTPAGSARRGGDSDRGQITPRALTAAGKRCLRRAGARMKIRAAVQDATEPGIFILAWTGCRPALGIDEAVARIEMHVVEGGGHSVPRFFVR
jgi:hypothetical protein